MDIMPNSGIVRISDLAVWLDSTRDGLIKSFIAHEIPIIKPNKFKSTWMIRLEDLK